MENVSALLQAAGASWQNVVKTNIYVTDMAQFQATTEVRRRYLPEPPPTSTLVQVTALAHPDLMVEIEAIAVLD